MVKNSANRKVTKIASHLPICCEQGTKNLDQIIKISKNTRVAFFTKSMLFRGNMKVLKLANMTYDWKLSQLKSCQHIINKVPIICAKLLIYPDILDLISSSNVGFWGAIKVHKPTNKSIAWK